MIKSLSNAMQVARRTNVMAYLASELSSMHWSKTVRLYALWGMHIKPSIVIVTHTLLVMSDRLYYYISGSLGTSGPVPSPIRVPIESRRPVAARY